MQFDLIGYSTAPHFLLAGLRPLAKVEHLATTQKQLPYSPAAPWIEQEATEITEFGSLFSLSALFS